MAEFAFGIFDHIERRDHDLGELYEGRLRLLELAEQAGFYCYHVAEHHGTPLGMAPSPGIFLGAVAQRTRRIHFGPLVYLLPLYNPIRLAEEICMLDQLSGGRMEVGVGRGVSPFELAYFNVPFLESREIFEEALDVIVAALRNERIAHRGEHYNVRGFPMELRPKQTPNPPFWYASSNPEHVVYAGRRGMNLVGVGTAALLSKSAAAFRGAWSEHHRRPESINPQVAEPKIGAVRHVYVGPDDSAAMVQARPAYKAYYNNLQKLWRDFYTVETHFTDDLDLACRHEAAIVGSPGAVADAVGRFFEESGCNYLILSFAWGSLSQEQSERSLELFASKVMPQFAPHSAGAAAQGRVRTARA
ncbi:MAG TPA: LLM class flavin-dependent oxidoreductase [Candidatus Binataceae bacterium]|jgi:alkanesulfonate monooxygenase SsuD/methylene tetrahydromethanopterin reductase-like flavin-dependent oxidoreductase (luciferase family)|nr:LLM class flavin-dependent oxidoreductase [Candidatus Binataceae bacterium]